jgi:hypothetical protein
MNAVVEKGNKGRTDREVTRRKVQAENGRQM